MILGPGNVSYLFRYSSLLLITGGTLGSSVNFILRVKTHLTDSENSVGTLSRISSTGAP